MPAFCCERLGGRRLFDTQKQTRPSNILTDARANYSSEDFLPIGAALFRAVDIVVGVVVVLVYAAVVVCTV